MTTRYSFLPRRRLLAAAAAAMAGISGSAHAEPVSLVRFGDGSEQLVRPKGDKVIVRDADGMPQFEASLEFLRGLAAEPLLAAEWDVERGQVRLSSRASVDLWVDCASVERMPIACAASFEVLDDGILQVGRGVEVATEGAKSYTPEGQPRTMSGGVPRCPGDPRCPRLKK